MSQPDFEHSEKIDWRISNITWLTAPLIIPGTPVSLPAGAAVKPVALIQYGRHRVSIAIPNATALFLELSQSYHAKAEYCSLKCISKKDKSGCLPDSDTFTFYEQIMASIVFACTSLEAFANELIPDTYVHVVTEKSSTRHYNKVQIERHLNLDTKLGDVLPGALRLPSPKGGAIWSAFAKLSDLRDRVIHMKTKDRECIGEDANSIWNALLSNPLPDTYKTAHSMMKHYFDAKGEAPRWFQKCPF